MNGLEATGDCYHAAGSIIALGPMSHRPRVVVPRDAVLVHGRPTRTREPRIQYGHAWIEYRTDDGRWLVREVANGADLTFPRDAYYRLGSIEPAECFRYTRTEARRMATTTGHWGPWEGPDAP